MITSRTQLKDNLNEEELVVTIDNGDFKLIDELVEAYSFKDRNSLIKFAIATLLQGNNNEGIFTIKTNDKNVKSLSKIEPSLDMIKERPLK